MSLEPNKIPAKLLISLWIYGFFCIICLISAISACDSFDKTEDNVGLVVGSSHITTDKLKSDMEFISAGMEMPIQQRDLIKKQLMEQCINHYLIIEYGKEHGIAISENELQNTLRDIRKEYTDAAFDEALIRGYVDLEQWKNRLREQLLVKKIIEKVTEGVTQPNYQDIKQYFEANQDEFKSPKMIEFRQIVTRTREEAKKILNRLRNGELMSELAKKYSTAPEAENGGKVGWVAEDHLSESMGEVLFSMPQGKISPVVETPYGYHIFEVISVRPAGAKELPDAIEEIQSKLLLQRREVFLKKWVQDLKNHFEVRVNQNLLNYLESS
ncbi:MAG: peptidylprolyl isomerase [Deltaproteobacteria bacterium]|nr:peptidylprolyl isomerase [Deltaproteobacteria bacterium]